MLIPGILFSISICINTYTNNLVGVIGVGFLFIGWAIITKK